MIEIAQHNDISLRSYGEEFCVLARRDGARIVVDGPVSVLLRKLNETVGIHGIQQLVRDEMPVPPDATVAVEIIRGLLQTMEVTPKGRLNTMLQHAPARFSDYCIQHRIPLIGMCEITYRCNLRCQHCYVLHKIEEEQPAHAESESVLRVIQSMSELGCLDITLTGGESTLHKSYLTFIKMAKALHMYTILKTNGTTFTRDRVEIYAEDPAHETELSLYGANPEIHDTFTAIPGSFEKTVRGMRELARVGLRCKVNCTVSEGNSHNLDEIEHLVEDLGHYVEFDDVIYGRLNGDRSPLELRIHPETRMRLISEGRLKQFQASPCIAGQMKVKVDAEGNVSTCELLPHSFGNVFVTPLERVWSSPNIRGFSNSVVETSISEQENNSLVRSCPGLNFLNTGVLRGKTLV
jgi:MoaA/NifB/PqqE/SkfB family radical SAM enzyme